MIVLGRTVRSTLPSELKQGRTGHFEKPFEVDGRTYYLSAIMLESGKLEAPIFVMGPQRHTIERYDESLYPQDVIDHFTETREVAKYVEVEHNLSKDQLAKSLRALAEQEGIDDTLSEEIVKSRRNKDKKNLEKWLDQLTKEAAHLHRQLLDTIAINLAILIKRWMQSGGIVNDTQIREMLLFIDRHYLLFANPEQRNQLRKVFLDSGLILPVVDIKTLLHESFKAGIFYEQLKDSMVISQVRQIIKSQPLSRETQLAMQLTEQMAGQYIRGMGHYVTQETERAIRGNNAKLIGGLIRDYIVGNLKVTTRNDELLLHQEVAHLDTDQTVASWRRLAGELRNRFKAEELGRNWERIAITETRWASNAGRLFGLQERGVKEMYWLVQPTACQYCKKLYLNPDGSPKIFKVADVIASFMQTGGMNVGLKASKIGEEGGWVVNGGVIHPHCRCRPMAKIKGVEPMVLREKEG